MTPGQDRPHTRPPPARTVGDKLSRLLLAATGVALIFVPFLAGGILMLCAVASIPVGALLLILSAFHPQIDGVVWFGGRGRGAQIPIRRLGEPGEGSDAPAASSPETGVPRHQELEAGDEILPQLGSGDGVLDDDDDARSG